MQTVGFFAGKFLPFHLGHVYAIMQASNHVDKLYVVLASDEETDKTLCNEADIKFIPAIERLSWMGETLRDLENIHILHVDEYEWDDTSRKIMQLIPEKITHVFSSEESYSEYFDKTYPDAEHVIIDNSRNTVNISATKIRNNILKHWDMLPMCARVYFVKKVCIIGTESCGKSTLTKQLAKYYNTNYVHEVGRDYCDRYKNQLTVNHFDSLAMDHWRLHEELSAKSNRVLFIDSEAIITNYYLELYGFKQSTLVEEIVKKQDFDLYLFLEPDVKWVDDGIRNQGDYEVRQKRNDQLKAMFRQHDISFISISGSWKERFDKARIIVNDMLKANS